MPRWGTCPPTQLPLAVDADRVTIKTMPTKHPEFGKGIKDAVVRNKVT